MKQPKKKKREGENTMINEVFIWPSNAKVLAVDIPFIPLGYCVAAPHSCMTVSTQTQA